MLAELPIVLHALHRSRTRANVLLELDATKIAFPGQLERACGIRTEKIHAALFGLEGEYKPEHGLVALGLARVVRTSRGDAYEITGAGRDAARLVAAQLAAKREQRAQWARSVEGS